MAVAVVTGGASGIGLALARAFAEQGMSPVLADLDPKALEAAAADLSAMGVAVHTEVVDVRDQRALERLADVAGTIGPIAVVCCNAGVTATGSNVWETPDGAVDFVMSVNLHGLLHTLRAFTPRLVAVSTPSTVVVTASMAGLVASPTSGAYAASKAAAVAVTKSLRAELAIAAPHVGVVLLNPGMVKTNLMQTSAAQQPADLAPGLPVEVTHAALNEYGADPADAASWVVEAIGAGRFWALPPTDDPFIAMLDSELTELGTEIR